MPLGREDLGSAVLELVTDPTKLRAGMAAARAETTQTLASANNALRGIGQKMTATGGQMTRGVTLPVIAAGAAIVSVGGDFEHTLSQIVGLVGVSRDQINAWKPEIEDLARSTGIGPGELAKGLYFVASSGIEASKAMGVLTIAARASEAGMGDIEMLADVLTGTMNAYAKSNLTAAHAMDVLVRGIQVGKAEPADFAASLGTVAPIAAQLGVTVEDLVGTMAVLSRVNSNVAENSTSLGQVLNTLLKPSNQTAEALKKMGLSAEDLRAELKEKGLLAVLKTLADHIGDNDEAIAQIFPNIRALRGVLNLTGQDATSVAEAMAKVADSSGALDAAVLAVADDAQVKMNKALASMQVELIVLASDVLPLVVQMLAGVASGVHDVVDWFTSLPGPVKEVAVRGLALLAVLGPILVVLGSIITAGTAVVGAFGTMATFLTATLIPRFAAFLTLLTAGAIQAFAAAIFATGIPALEALGVAVLGLESAAAPLLVIAAAIGAIALAASGATPTVEAMQAKLAELEADHGWGRNQALIDAMRAKIDELKQAEHDEAEANREYWAGIGQQFHVGEIMGAVNDTIDGIREGLASGKYAIKNGAVVMAEGIPASVREKGGEAVRAVTTSIADMARAIRDGRQAIVDAMAQTIDDAFDPLILAADIAATKTELAEQRKIAAAKGYTQAQIDAAHKAAKTDKQREAADAMHTKAEVAEAKRRTLELEKQLAVEIANQTKYGDDATRLARLKAIAQSDALVKGLNSRDEARQKAAKAAAGDLAKEMVALMNKTGNYGLRTGNAYVDGLIDSLETRFNETKASIGPYARMFRAFSPPGPESPLHGIDVWGRKTGEAYVGPFVDALTRGRAAVRATLGHLAGDAQGPGGPLGDVVTRIQSMGAIRVEHVITGEAAEALARAGFDDKAVGQALAEGVNASGLFAHLQGLQALSGSG